MATEINCRIELNDGRIFSNENKYPLSIKQIIMPIFELLQKQDVAYQKTYDAKYVFQDEALKAFTDNYNAIINHSALIGYSELPLNSNCNQIFTVDDLDDCKQLKNLIKRYDDNEIIIWDATVYDENVAPLFLPTHDVFNLEHEYNCVGEDTPIDTDQLNLFARYVELLIQHQLCFGFQIKNIKRIIVEFI